MKSIALAACSALALASPAAASAQDPLQWLEAPRDERALEWAKKETEDSRARIATMPRHDEVETELKTLLSAGDPPPEFQLLGPVALRFQRSLAHPHGVLSVAERGADGVPSDWREVLDVDALGKAEGVAYELRFGDGSLNCAPPVYTRCLLSLSPQGGDEVELREFDLVSGAFVEGGFRVPASRAFAVWLDRDRLLIEHSVGDAPRLPTGWPVNVAIWNRGTPLAAAKTVFTAQPTDALMSLSATGEGKSRVGIITRAIDYSTLEHIVVRSDGTVETAPLPAKLKMSLGTVGGGKLFVQLAEPATVAGRSYPAESVLAYDTDETVPPGKRLALVYSPSDEDFMTNPFGGMAPGQSALRMIVTKRGVQRIVTARENTAGWTIADSPPEAIATSVSFASVDPESNAMIVKRGGYLLPNRLELVDGKKDVATLFSEKPVFDERRFVVELKTATSRDGTPIDYYLLRPRVLASPGKTPLLMTGYGAFGISLAPEYMGYSVGGKSLVPWLTRGGAFVLPLIRGGGDRGAAWHQAAMREKRQNSYDDFAAVTEDLIESGLTSSKHIGVFGSSNGGLLAAVMGIQRPDLYGAIVSDVPLTDLVRMPFMGMGAAWVNEYGDPNDPAMRKVIDRYSPYHNIMDGKSYPPFLISVATSDNRVGPGHARKLAARLKEAGATVYYLEDQEGGHGVSDPLSRPELMADRMTFLFTMLK